MFSARLIVQVTEHANATVSVCHASIPRNEEFSGVFTILKSQPKILQKLHKALVKELYDNMSSDLKDIVNEPSLQEGLYKISKLSDANSSVAEVAWRPPGNVSLHLRSLDAHKIKECSKELEKQVSTLEEENASLMETIATRRSQINCINENITRLLNRSPTVIDALENRLKSIEKSLALLNR